MDSLINFSILHLLIFTQLISADLSTGGGKIDESSIAAPQPPHEDIFTPIRFNEQQGLLRLLFLTGGNNRARMQFRPNVWGIPYRPVRRMGSEFLGKRSDIPAYEEEEDDIEKRARMGSEFLGKRGMGSEFLGKRGMGSEFLGKRAIGSEFLGKRRMGSEFLGKRGMGSEFLGKRGMGSEFLGKRGMGSEFLGKRRMGSEFLGKRGMGSEFLGKRRMGSEFLGKRKIGSEFLGKRDYDYDIDLEQQPFSFYNYGNALDNKHSLQQSSLFNSIPEKRGGGGSSEVMGFRKPDNGYDYSWKRGRLGSEFLGKRSVPEQPHPYLSTASHMDISTGADSTSTEEH